jgi:hypothetical protein
MFHSSASTPAAAGSDGRAANSKNDSGVLSPVRTLIKSESASQLRRHGKGRNMPRPIMMTRNATVTNHVLDSTRMPLTRIPPGAAAAASWHGRRLARKEMRNDGISRVRVGIRMGRKNADGGGRVRHYD